MLSQVKKILNKSLFYLTILLLLLLSSLFIELFISGFVIVINNPASLVSDTNYSVNGNERILYLRIDMDTPRAGIISKGFRVNYIFNIEGRLFDGIRTIEMGDSRLITFEIPLTQEKVDKALGPEGLNVETTIWITPIYAGNLIEAAERRISLGSITV